MVGRWGERTRTALVALGLLVVSANVVGCSGAGGSGAAGPRGESSAGPAPVLRSDAEIVLPLDDYQLTSEQQYNLAKAINTLGRACMDRFGLSWPQTPPWIADGGARNARRYGVTDAGQARSEGYHATDVLVRSNMIAAQEAALAPPSEDARTVWSGSQTVFQGQPIPVGGCSGEAAEQLAGGRSVPDPDLAQRLQLQTFQKAKADSRVTAAFAVWRDCMRQRGYEYSDPFAAVADQRWQTEQTSEEEIAVAVTDVACKADVRLPGTMYVVETAYQRRAIKQYATELRDLRAYLTMQLDNARTVLTDSR